MGLSRSTLVVYVGDNGYMLGQHGRFEKHCFYEQAVRIPLIMRWPGHIEGSRRIAIWWKWSTSCRQCCTSSICRLRRALHGIDLVPLLRGKPGAQGARRRFQRVSGK